MKEKCAAVRRNSAHKPIMIKKLSALVKLISIWNVSVQNYAKMQKKVLHSKNKKSKNTVRFRIIYLIRISQKNLSNINGCKKNQEKLKLALTG